MKPGFWQIVFWVGLVVVLFHRPLLALVRALAGSVAKSAPQKRAPFRGSDRCGRCGAALPSGARFCPRCGHAQDDAIDVSCTSP